MNFHHDTACLGCSFGADASYRIKSDFRTYYRLTVASYARVLNLRRVGSTVLRERASTDIAHDYYDQANITPVILNTSYVASDEVPIKSDKTLGGEIEAGIDDKTSWSTPNSNVLLEVDFSAFSTTAFDQSYGVLTFDVGQFLIDSTQIGLTTWSRSSYVLRASTMFVGILQPFVTGLARVSVGWGVAHTSTPAGEFDGLDISVNVRISGLAVTEFYRWITYDRLSRQHDSQPVDEMDDEDLVFV